MEEKKKRVDAAQNALSLLQTVCIVWPNSASEVLLAGSFDGWNSQVCFSYVVYFIYNLYVNIDVLLFVHSVYFFWQIVFL